MVLRMNKYFLTSNLLSSFTIVCSISQSCNEFSGSPRYFLSISMSVLRYGLYSIYNVCLRIVLGNPFCIFLLIPFLSQFTLRKESQFVQVLPLFPHPVLKHLHFPTLNNICQFSEQSTNLSLPSCNCCLSP